MAATVIILRLHSDLRAVIQGKTLLPVCGKAQTQDIRWQLGLSHEQAVWPWPRLMPAESASGAARGRRLSSRVPGSILTAVTWRAARVAPKVSGKEVSLNRAPYYALVSRICTL